MAKKTKSDLKNQALIIKNETIANANSAERVGGELEDIIDSLLHVDDALGTYVKTTGIPKAIGGLPAGYVPSGSINKLLDDLLYEKLPPAASLNGFPLYEKGTTQIPALSGTITPRSGTITARRLKRNGSLIQTINTNTFSLVDEAVGQNTTYQLEVDTTEWGTTIATSQLSFVAPTYTGVLAAGATEAQIKSLPKLIRNKANYAGSYSPTLQRYYFCYPASMGLLSSVRDASNFEVMGAFVLTQANFTLANGSLELYNIYQSDADTTQINFANTFIF